jgi:AcrR family transcriptional regulator
MSEPAKKRPYYSRLRQERAQATRQKILEATRRLFAAQGYVATTLSRLKQASLRRP